MTADNRSRIIRAATPVFVRYGFKRTTMKDIAREADVSRQTLYGLFANKEEVLRATMNQYIDEAIAGIEKDLDDAMPLAEQIELVFEWVVVRGYKLMQQAPDAKDLVEGANQVGADLLEKKSAQIQSLMVSILEPYAEQIQTTGMTTEDLAQLLCAASGSSKYIARNLSHLRQLNSDLITLTTAALKLSTRQQGK